MRILAALLMLSLTAPAFAQSKFVPFTVDEKTARELETFLVDQPFKFSAPVLQWLAVQQQRARDEAAKPPEKKD